MDFNHTEDRRMLADLLTRYVAEQYPMEARHAIAASPQGYSPQQWGRFAELGVIGALFGEEHGGFGGTGFDLAVVFEALGAGLVLEPLLASAVLAGSAIAHAAAGPQADTLAALADGSRIATLAHEEPESRYDLQRVATLARRDSQGYVLDGRKAVVGFGAQAQLLVVSARTSGEVADPAGISLFLVPAGTPGVHVRAYPNIDGTRAAEIVLDQVRLPATALLGAEGQGLASLEHAAGRGIVALCAEALGAMEAAKKATIEYLQTRRQFGKPIGSFQALQHRMADVLLEIEQARSAVINAAAALDADRVTRERALSAAKYTIGRVGALVAEECIQLHGGIGMTWELPLPHYAKRLVMIDHQLGDEDHHLARFIALGAQAAKEAA
ncbi:MAG TPA: acyl-CoA dehydrogenase [Ramlibacter sp.]|jgi:alkylation response protein AidB-like acyl-CoA dehydrogenase|uniref:acyl-CoA dehydrogenase family protein n=1 Tax=Ramlibacter sp. TaxID=1917967 RepID=UPI002D2487D2|nr:acyl-CoA dehydrogenase [Ramlibacter sp.]HZY19272.1 acyl-CoA dehydrogenase [Ramlibacter sp.]